MQERDSVSGTLAFEARGITKSFGDISILKGINLSIGYGESVVILGPNGAGKTTLIKILATIMKPSSGEIVVHGLDLKNNAQSIRRKIGMVTHHTMLYGNLTAYENLKFYSCMYDVPRIEDRIQEIVAMVGMTDRLHSRIDTLSRGMQQRISIARALIHNPAIMLLDEAETGLDQESTSMLWGSFQSGEKERHSLILTTHNFERGLELGDRILILNRGKIVYEASRKDLNLSSLHEVYENNTRVKA
jgi:heme exporter protein A